VRQYVEDMFGDIAVPGDTLIVPRPSVTGTGYNLAFVRLVKINAKTITVQPIEKNGDPVKGSRYNKNADGHQPPFSLNVNETYGDHVRLVKYTP
jgi:hypothetical protein